MKIGFNNILLYAYFLLTILTACSEKKKNNKNLPSSAGKTGEIVIVISDEKWEGKTGQIIRDIFAAPTPGLYRNEPMFTLHQVAPLKLNGLLKRSKNMIFVTTLDDETKSGQLMKSIFSQKIRTQIKNDPIFFNFKRKDKFARGQAVLYLFGNDDKSLINNMLEEKESLQWVFEYEEQKRITEQLYKTQEQKQISSELFKKHQFKIRIPYGYQLADNSKNFVWFRKISQTKGTPLDKSFFISYKKYTSQDLFEKDKIIAMRNDITREKIFGDPKRASTYVRIQEEVPLSIKEVNFKGQYSKEIRGLWKTNNNSMGGPFISYVIADPYLKRIYYIEGFVYAPNKERSNYLRELRAILWTFQTKYEREIKKKKKANS